MFKSSESTHSRQLSFARVNSHAARVPSWVAGNAAIDTAPSVGSLRAPRVPTGLTEAPPPMDPEDLELFDVSRMATPENLAEPAASEPHYRAADEAPMVRRVDTLIEELNPRAEEEAIGAIRTAVAALADSRAKVLEQSERQMIEMVTAIARRVIAREISLDPSVIKGLVREGISALGQRDRVIVRVGSFFGAAVEELYAQLQGTGMKCEIYVDPALGESGCMIQTDLGSVDESIDARLAALLENVLSDSNR